MADIETPCNKVCTLDSAGTLCVGCGRTLAEIAGWARFSSDERRRIISTLADRLSALQGQRGQRADVT